MKNKVLLEKLVETRTDYPIPEFPFMITRSNHRKSTLHSNFGDTWEMSCIFSGEGRYFIENTFYK